MKQLIIFLICGCIVKLAFCQSGPPGLLPGKYEGIEIHYLKAAGDTSDKVDRMNRSWGKKDLTLDSNGTFVLEFPVFFPTSRVCPNRFARGRWVRNHDTLVLNSDYSYKDFIRVRERRTGRSQIQVKVMYDGEKNYYPDLDIIVNNQTARTGGKPWTYFPLDTVGILKINRYAGPTSRDREWVYKPLHRNSNRFQIWVTDTIDGNNFVLENYKLLIVGSTLVQIDPVFFLEENRFMSLSFR